MTRLLTLLVLGDEQTRLAANDALERRGGEAVPGYIDGLSHPDPEVRWRAAWFLGELTAQQAEPALPALADAMNDDVWLVRSYAAATLAKHGNTLRDDGDVRLWVVPRVYWQHIAWIVCGLILWFGAWSRFPRHRPARTSSHLALISLVAAPPMAVRAWAVAYAVTRHWAYGFLPDPPTLLSLPTSAALSVAVAAALPAVWVCQRKPRAAQ